MYPLTEYCLWMMRFIIAIVVTGLAGILFTFLLIGVVSAIRWIYCAAVGKDFRQDEAWKEITAKREEE